MMLRTKPDNDKKRTFYSDKKGTLYSGKKETIRNGVDNADVYPAEEVSRILSECMTMGAFHKNTVKRLLASKALKVPVPSLSGFAGPAPLIRNLSVYREVIHE